MKDFLKEYGQTLFNILLFLGFGVMAAVEAHRSWAADQLGYVEISFTIQNMIMVTMILVRRQHQAVDQNLFNQAVALVAFCSGVAFFGQPPTSGPLALTISQAITFASNALGAITLLNLGRSFGILIAFRKVKTGGLYSVVRHPMYGTDILLRIGFVVSHFTWLTVGVFTLSTGCYLYRAVLEERFLSRQPEYVAYKERVRYRFIPFVF